MKLKDLKDIEPVLTIKQFELLKNVGRIHEDPTTYTKPEQMKHITRLIKLGLIKQIRDPDVTKYEATEKGKALLKQ
jgi:DNA-binding MarR family transcriptional regulator